MEIEEFENLKKLNNLFQIESLVEDEAMKLIDMLSILINKSEEKTKYWKEIKDKLESDLLIVGNQDIEEFFKTT